MAEHGSRSGDRNDGARRQTDGDPVDVTRWNAAAAVTGRVGALVPADRWHAVWAGLVVAVAGASAWATPSGNVAATVALALALSGAGALLPRAAWYAGTIAAVWFVAAIEICLIAVLGSDARFDGPSVLITGLCAAASTAVGAGLNALRRRDIATLLAAQHTAAAAAVRDELTGVANPRGLAMVAGQMLESARRAGDAVHCIFLDVTNLTKVNDELGVEAGDEVLSAVAEALTRSVRGTDVVARWHGDDFCVVGPGPGMPPIELERRVRDRLLLAPPVEVEIWTPEVSAGGSMLAPWDTGTLDTLLGQAERELAVRRKLRRDRAARRLAPRRAPEQPAPSADQPAAE